jgi:FkbM family methyltransferase
MLSRKLLKRRIRKIRDRLAAKLFDTRYGRELMVAAIGLRILTITADCGDHRMSFSPHDYIGRKIFRKGHFERDHVDRLLEILKSRNLLRENSVLLELGGNIGTQTVYFALSRAYRQIVSVEPDPRNFALLEANIAQNDLQAVITPVNCAAGEDAGEIDFFMHRNNHGKSSALRQSPTDTKISVPVRPVATILAEAGIAAEDIGLVWMDIEGYEPVACRSMQMLMARRVPFYTEFTPAFYGQAQARDFVAMLAGHYEDCLLISDERCDAIKVKNIPIDQGQFDILLLP